MPRKTKNKKECFIGEKTQDSFKDNVRKNVCLDLPVDYEQDGQYYCVLHFPNDQKHKNTDFKSIFQSRLENQTNCFQYVYFPDRVYLSQLEFSTEVDFLGYTFTQDADFINIDFNERVDFSNTVFMKNTLFAHLTFIKNIHFSNAVFEANAQFIFLDNHIGDTVFFTNAVFRGDAIFDGINSLRGKEIRLRFDDVLTEKAERIHFKNTVLYPNWFVNINSRKFIFHNIDWKNADETTAVVKAEIKILKDLKIYPRQNRLLTLACRQLADNYEENNHFEQASIFRQMANESKRLEEYKGFKIWSLHWWYWLSSYYGERWIRAITVLGGILLVFAVIYTKTYFQICPIDKPIALSIQQNVCEIRTLTLEESVLQSLATAIFQNIDYQKPVTLTGEIIRILEKILVPLQAALLALAIRRKFMR